jgi:hypothetical protein
MNNEIALACLAVPSVQNGANQVAAGNAMIGIQPARFRQLAGASSADP